MLAEETDTERAAVYRKQLETAEQRIEKANRDIRSTSILPTHRDIAEVLGLSKGSIDSGLYYLRQALDDFQRN